MSSSPGDRLAEALATPPPPSLPEGGLRVDDLVLRLPTVADVDSLAPAFADPAVGGEAGLPAFDAEALRLMLDERLPEMIARGELLPIVVVESGSGRILGGASLHHYAPWRQAVEVGYWLYEAARGRGVATRVVETLARHVFATGIYRLQAVVRVGNVPSERVLERAGFRREGLLRRYLRHDSARVDATLFALLADDRP